MFCRSQIRNKGQGESLVNMPDAVKLNEQDDPEAKKVRRGLNSAKNKSCPSLETPEPWLDPVYGTELLADLKTLFERFLVLAPGAAETLALWTLHTYCFEVFSLSPFLTITSPTKQCGKSTVMDLLGAVCSRVICVSNATPASIFRAIDKWQPTLLFDEADAFIRNNEEIRCILNASHKKRGAAVLRTVGENHEPKLFSVWTPKAIAAIGNLQPTLMDRSIVINMQRKKPTDQVERLEDQLLDGPEIENICRKCVRWATDNIAAVEREQPFMQRDLNDRVADNWRTLKKVASVAGWNDEVNQALLYLLPRTDDADDLGSMLLADIKTLFGDQEGATINMNGTALYQGAATVFLAQVYGIEIGLGGMLLVVTMAVGASIGSPATPGVGIVILSMVLGSIGVPAAGVALIMGVDRILDMSRTAINVSGDIVACKLMDRWIGSSMTAREELAQQKMREAERKESGEDVVTGTGK